MVREKDAVWQYWKMCDVDVKGKQYAACRYCNLKLQVNASRFKQHLVVTCTDVPNDVKAKFQDAVLKQSCATTKQKLHLPLSNDTGASVSATCGSTSSTVTQKRKRSIDTTDELDGHYDSDIPTDLEMAAQPEPTTSNMPKLQHVSPVLQVSSRFYADRC